MFTPLFWKDALERALATAAQSVIVIAGASDSGFGLIDEDMNLKLLAFAAVSGFALSILKAVAASYKNNTDTASFTVDNKELGNV